MDTMRMPEQQWRFHTSYTYGALHKLVAAMDEIVRKDGGERFVSWSRNKVPYLKFLSMLKVTIQAMVLDRLVQESTCTEQVLARLQAEVDQFSLAFPNWQNAYQFAGEMFTEQREYIIAAVSMIRHMR